MPGVNLSATGGMPVARSTSRLSDGVDRLRQDFRDLSLDLGLAKRPDKGKQRDNAPSPIAGSPHAAPQMVLTYPDVGPSGGLWVPAGSVAAAEETARQASTTPKTLSRSITRSTFGSTAGTASASQSSGSPPKQKFKFEPNADGLDRLAEQAGKFLRKKLDKLKSR